MSAATSDSIDTTPGHAIIDYISQIQRKGVFTTQRFRSIRLRFFQSIGLSIVLYFVLQLPFVVYALLQLLVFVLTIAFWPAVQAFRLVLPKHVGSVVLIPLFCLLSVVSIFVAKFAVAKRQRPSPSYAVPVAFLIILLLQTVFVLRPLALSTHEQQRNSSLTPLAHGQTPTDGNEQMSSSSSSSSVKDKHSNLIDRDKLVGERCTASNEQHATANQKLPRQSSSPSVVDQASSNIWPADTLVHSLSTSQMQQLPRHRIDSPATDGNCDEHTQFIDRRQLPTQSHLDDLDSYRRRCPFPVYLAVLKSNGPQCYGDDLDTFCAPPSRRGPAQLTKFLYSFGLFWMIISIPLLAFVLISTYYRQYNKRRSLRDHQMLSSQPTAPALPQTTVRATEEHPDVAKVENEFRRWFEQQQRNGFRLMGEAYRRALNERCSRKHDHPQIDSVQLSNVTVSRLSHTPNPPIVVNATMTIDSVMFTLLNATKREQCLVEVRGLAGELRVALIDDIEVQFQATELRTAEIVRTSQASPPDGKQLAVKQLVELIHRTPVQFAFKQETTPQRPETPLLTTSPLEPVPERPESPVIAPRKPENEQTPAGKETNRLLVRVVKAVQLHDVEQPYCILELNHPKQVHRTNTAKNGLNPFWDEHFLFECDAKSSELHLKIMDRRKPSRKLHGAAADVLYADLSIPFSYVTSTIYKQDVRITPQHPESIIRIEFSTLSEEEAAAASNGSDLDSIADTQSWSSHKRAAQRIDQVRQLSPSTDATPNDQPSVNNSTPHTPRISRPGHDIFPTPSEADSRLDKPRKSRSFMSSLRSFASFRGGKKNPRQGKPSDNGALSSPKSEQSANTIPHSFSAEPFLYSNATSTIAEHPPRSITRSFRSIFRSGANRKPLQADNFILDHPDLLSTSPESRKKRSFFQRFRSKRKSRRLQSLSNSLTSYDRTRTESVQNTPVRANGGRPVTMNK